jgi:cytidine deaminase
MMATSELGDEDHELIEAAKETADRLYLKDIHTVAAALRTSDGEIFTGIHTNANVGFADICGEVAAICHALAHGHREYDSIVAVRTDGQGGYEILPPCGRCREVINDFSGNTWVIVGNLEDPRKVKVSDLLPLK